MRGRRRHRCHACGGSGHQITAPYISAGYVIEDGEAEPHHVAVVKRTIVCTLCRGRGKTTARRNQIWSVTMMRALKHSLERFCDEHMGPSWRDELARVEAKVEFVL